MLLLQETGGTEKTEEGGGERQDRTGQGMSTLQMEPLSSERGKPPERSGALPRMWNANLTIQLTNISFRLTLDTP